MKCSVENCDAEAVRIRAGLCDKHYKRKWRNGTTISYKCAPGTGSIDSDGYRRHSIKGINIREHILVAAKALGKPLPIGAVVHHVDGNKSNNKTSNLVICPNDAYHKLLHKREKWYDWLKLDPSINLASHSRRKRCNKTGYTGVYFHKKTNKYVSAVRHSKRYYHIGTYDTAEEAHLAREEFLTCCSELKSLSGEKYD